MVPSSACWTARSAAKTALKYTLLSISANRSNWLRSFWAMCRSSHSFHTSSYFVLPSLCFRATKVELTHSWCLLQSVCLAAAAVAAAVLSCRYHVSPRRLKHTYFMMYCLFSHACLLVSCARRSGAPRCKWLRLLSSQEGGFLSVVAGIQPLCLFQRSLYLLLLSS